MELKQKHHAQQKAAAGKPNLTGIPLQMKQSFERSSGLSFDDVRVHYHSSLPARLGALAYTRGSHVYVSSGQERHLGHELGHVIQQKQGRVRATSVLNGVRLNTSPIMEREADALSRQAARGEAIQMRQGPSSEVVQMVQYPNISAMWRGLCKGVDAAKMIKTAIKRDPVLNELYQDAVQQVPKCDFRLQGSLKAPYITLNRNATLPYIYIIFHQNWPNDLNKQYIFISAIIHELTHAAARERYHRNIPDRIHDIHNPSNEVKHVAWLNMNLPPNPTGAPAPVSISTLAATSVVNLPDISAAQWTSMQNQKNDLKANVQHLHAVVHNDTQLQRRYPNIHHRLIDRLNYMERRPLDHYDAVLGDMMFYLQFNGLQNTPSYGMMQRMLREANDRRHQRRWFGNNETPYNFSTASSWFSRY